MSRRALTVRERFDAAWFSPMPPELLACVRMLAGAYALLRVSVLFGFVLQRAARGDAFVRPVGLMSLLPHAPSFAMLAAAVAVAAASGTAFVAGFRYRWTAPFFVASLFAVLSYFNSFDMLYHSDHLLVLHTFVVALAPAADVWSLDALRRGRSGQGHEIAPDWRYGWPIRLLCALTVSVYLLAGVAKVAWDGWEWALGDALRAQVAKDALRKQLFGEDIGILAPWVLRQWWISMAIGVSTLVMELGAPLFLLSRRASRAWAAAAFVMHWGIFFIMGVTFRYQLFGIAFLSFVPPEWLAGLSARVQRRQGVRAHAIRQSAA